MRIRIRRKISVQEVSNMCFFITYACFLSFSFLGHIEMYRNLLKPITIILLVFLSSIFLLRVRECTVKSGIIVGGLLIGLIASAFITADFGFVKLVLFIFLSKGIKIDKCIKWDIALRIILITYVIFLYYKGIAPDRIAYMGTSIRHSMGFTNPNAFGMAVGILSLEILYLAKMRFNIIAFCFVIIIIVYADSVAHCRTAMIIVLLALVLCLFNTFQKGMFSKTIIHQICSYIPIILLIVSFVFSILYIMHNQIAIIVDRLLTRRLYFISKYFGEYDWHIIGHKILEKAIPLDNLYAYLFFGQGIIITVIFMWIFSRVIKQLFAHEMGALAIVLVLFAVYGLCERLWIYIDYNIFMISFGAVLFPDEFYHSCVEEKR